MFAQRYLLELLTIASCHRSRTSFLRSRLPLIQPPLSPQLIDLLIKACSSTICKGRAELYYPRCYFQVQTMEYSKIVYGVWLPCSSSCDLVISLVPRIGSGCVGSGTTAWTMMRGVQLESNGLFT